MNGGTVRRGDGRLLAGAILIGLGVIYALDSVGVLSAGNVLQYWPLVLVGIGILKVSQARLPAQRTGGVVFIAIGVMLLLWTLHIYWFRSRYIWPILLLLVGASLIWQSIAHRRSPTPEAREGSPAERILEGARARLDGSREWREAPSDTGSVLNEFAIMGGGDRVVRTQDFRGGEITAIMGGFGIDLRGAAIAGDSATIHIFTLWGGVDLKVPEDWNVVMAGAPILGVFTNSARTFRPGDAAAKTLVVKGVAIMGGIEVKN
jgi:predicted membrane protein